MCDLKAEPGWTFVVDCSLIVQIKVLQACVYVKALHERMLAFLARVK